MSLHVHPNVHTLTHQGSESWGCLPMNCLGRAAQALGQITQAIGHAMQYITSKCHDVFFSRTAQVFSRTAQVVDVSYGQKNVDAYAKYSETNHGADGALFLDRFFMPAIENLQGKRALDIGCGAAPWSIYAAKQGGVVSAIDIQPEMIEAARLRVSAAGVTDAIELAVGDASALGFRDNFFDREISICVACNLPQGIYERSFREMARTLKQGGIAVIGAPHSLDTIFTNGSRPEADVQERIAAVLAILPDNPSQDMITTKLSELTEVLSATFQIKNNRLALVTAEQDLVEGEQIWRKLPSPIVPNRYHSQESYRKEIRDAGLDIVRIELPRFSSQEARVAYNEKASAAAQLGPEYVSQAPFIIYHLTKK